jgi:hypothetical protein
VAKHVYFFTDPLAAVWMVRHHRFKVQAGPFCLQPESIDRFFEMLGRGVACERYLVHPESIPLLEPKAGDLVEEGAARVKVKKLTAKDFPLTGTSYEVLQRGGRAFIAPERATA